MKILCVIPARGASKRLPNKHLLELDGKPVIGHVFDAAKKSKYEYDILVVSEDVRIQMQAQSQGLQVISRPKEMYADEAPIQWTLLHALSSYEATNGKVHVVLWLQADCPIRQDGIIDRVLDKLVEDPNATACVTVEKVPVHPKWMKVVNQAGYLGQYLEGTINEFRKQDLGNLYRLDGHVVAILADTLRSTKKNNWLHSYLGSTVRYVQQEFPYTLGLDTEEDYKLAKLIMGSQWRST